MLTFLNAWAVGQALQAQRLNPKQAEFISSLFDQDRRIQFVHVCTEDDAEVVGLLQEGQPFRYLEHHQCSPAVPKDDCHWGTVQWFRTLQTFGVIVAFA